MSCCETSRAHGACQLMLEAVREGHIWHTESGAWHPLHPSRSRRSCTAAQQQEMRRCQAMLRRNVLDLRIAKTPSSTPVSPIFSCHFTRLVACMKLLKALLRRLCALAASQWSL